MLNASRPQRVGRLISYSAYVLVLGLGTEAPEEKPVVGFNMQYAAASDGNKRLASAVTRSILNAFYRDWPCCVSCDVEGRMQGGRCMLPTPLRNGAGKFKTLKIWG